MKIKQTAVWMFGITTVVVGVAFAVPVHADNNDGSGPGKCSEGNNVSFSDACAQANLRASGLSQVEADRVIRECDSGGGTATLGRCWNALGTCKANVVNASDCSNSGLIQDASRRCMGEEGGCEPAGYMVDQWDRVIDDHNAAHGLDGDRAIKTNKGLRGDRQREYDAQKESICRQKYENDVAKYRQCLSDMGDAFSTCYDNLGGYSKNGLQSKSVNQTDLGNCLKADERYRKYAEPLPSDLTNKQDCEAAGYQWVQASRPAGFVGPIPFECQYKPGQDPCEDHGGMSTDGSGKCNDGTTPQKTGSNAGDPNNTDSEGNCGGARTVLFPSSSIPGCNEEGLPAIGGILKFVMLILSVGVGIVAVAGIVYGAILYSSARDDSGQTQQAITIIRNVVIGLLLYVFMVTILNWLVPGGVIG